MISTIQAAIDGKLVPALSLESMDVRFASTLRRSLMFGPGSAVIESCRAAFAAAAPIGSALQQTSFALMVLLFLILAAPQFANDKEGLALLVVAGCGLRVAGALLNGKERYSPSAVDGIVLLYFAANLVSSCASHYLKESLFGLAKLLVYVLAYFWFTACIQAAPRRRIAVVLLALVSGALAVSLYGLYQYKIGVAPLATWEDPTIEDKATRVFSTLGNPNLLAGYLLPVVPLSLSLACISLFSGKLWRLGSVPLLAATAVITLATFLTGSRGGYIGLILAGASVALVACNWLWLERPRARVPLMICLAAMPLAAVAVLHFALPSFEHRFLSIFAGSEHSSNAYRLNVWHSSIAMLKDNWWLGIGTGNKTFRLAYGLYMRSSYDALGTYCVPLEVAVETGIFGLLVFAWLILACLARAHSRFWSSADPSIRWLAIGATASMVGLMSHGLVDTVFYRPQVQFIFWLAVSLMVALPSAYPISDKHTAAD